jgi:hypothetical protein
MGISYCIISDSMSFIHSFKCVPTPTPRNATPRNATPRHTVPHMTTKEEVSGRRRQTRQKHKHMLRQIKQPRKSINLSSCNVNVNAASDDSKLSGLSGATNGTHLCSHYVVAHYVAMR